MQDSIFDFSTKTYLHLLNTFKHYPSIILADHSIKNLHFLSYRFSLLAGNAIFVIQQTFLQMRDDILNRPITIFTIASSSIMSMRSIYNFRSTSSFDFTEFISSDVASRLQNSLPKILLKKSIFLLEKLKTQLLVIDQSSNLMKFQIVYSHWKNIIISIQ